MGYEKFGEDDRVETPKNVPTPREVSVPSVTDVSTAKIKGPDPIIVEGLNSQRARVRFFLERR